MAEKTDGYGESVLQLHLAEYQALTTRITNWITLQFSILPLIGGVLLLLADAHEIFPPVVTIWANAIIVEIGIAAYLYALYEIMTSAQYIECKLTSLIHVGQAPFWQYEHYKKGGTPTLLWVFT